MLRDRRWHHYRPHSGVNRVDQDSLFVLHQSPREGYDDALEIKAEYVSYVGESAISANIHNSKTQLTFAIYRKPR